MTNTTLGDVSFPLDLDGLKPSSWNTPVGEKRKDVLGILFPEARARLFALLLSAPPKEYYVRELKSRTGFALHTIQDELRKLTAVGLLTSWSNGYHRFYRARREHALYAHLLAIVNASAQLPKARHSDLQRPKGRPRRRKKAEVKSRALALDRPRFKRRLKQR